MRIYKFKKSKNLGDLCLFLLLFFVTYFFFLIIDRNFQGLKNRVNHSFYDLLTVTSIRNLETQDSTITVEFTDKDLGFFSSENEILWKFLAKLDAYSFTKAYLVLSPQIFDYRKDFFLNLSKKVSFPLKTYIGISPKGEDERWLNYGNGLNLFFSKTNRNFRREVIRTYPFSEKSLFSDFSSKNKLSFKNRKKEGEVQKVKKLRFINYSSLEKLNKVSIRDFLEKDFDLNGKTIFFGFSGFRKKEISYHEGTLFNSPWEGEGAAEKQGTPLLYLYPTILFNILNKSFIYKETLSSSFLFQMILFSLPFFSWFLKYRFLGLLFFLFQGGVLALLSFVLFNYAQILPDCFYLYGSTFLGSFLGSFFVEKRHNQRKKEEYDSLASMNLSSTKDNQLFLSILREIDLFIEESKSTLENIILKESNHFDEDLKKLIREKSTIVFTNVKGLYHYVLALERNGVFKEDVFLRSVVDGLLASFQDHISEKRVEVVMLIPKTLWVKTDRILMQAILYNIIFNAIKYTFYDTLIEIKGDKVKGGYLLSISDQGPGFKLSQSEKDESSQVLSRKGYGLGLYLSRVIAQKIDIRLSLKESTEFKSIFEIFIKE